MDVRLAVRLAEIRACVDCDFLGGPKLTRGPAVGGCVYVEPRLRVSDLRPYTPRPSYAAPSCTRVVAPTFIYPLRKKRPRGAERARRNYTCWMLRTFARMIHDGVKDLPYEVSVCTKQGYPRLKIIEPAESSEAYPSWSAHVAWVAAKAARAASHSAIIEARVSAHAVRAARAARTRRAARKRMNDAFLREIRGG